MILLQRKKYVIYFLSYPHLVVVIHWKISALFLIKIKEVSELLLFASHLVRPQISS